jgi:hypothetical protein
MKIMNSYTSSFSSMRLLFRLALFNLGLAILLTGVMNFLNNERLKQNPPNDEAVKITNIMAHKVDAELAVFGSSVAQVHFNPYIISKITGKSSYNFGLDGTPLIQHKGVLKEFLSYSKAEVIVLAVSYLELEKRTQVHKLKNYILHLDNPNVYNALYEIDPGTVWKTKNVPFYDYIHFNEEYRKILIKHHKVIQTQNRSYKGFQAFHAKWMEQSWMRESRVIPYATVDNNVVISYREIIDLASQQGKKVVIVLTPIYREGQNNIINLNEVREVYQNLAENGGYFIDFTKSDICNNRDYFYNYGHLNADGADVFTLEFSKILLQLEI